MSGHIRWGLDMQQVSVPFELLPEVENRHQRSVKAEDSYLYGCAQWREAKVQKRGLKVELFMVHAVQWAYENDFSLENTGAKTSLACGVYTCTCVHAPGICRHTHIHV